MKSVNTTKSNIDLTVLVYRVLIATSLLFVHPSIVCPMLIMLGLLTRGACLGVAAVTLTGLFIVHAHDPLVIRDTPYMYSVAVGMIFLIGPGKYSIDQWITNHKSL